MLKIRLQRTGRRNLPAYSVVVTEGTAPVKGKFLEKVGFYSPLSKGCKLDLERIAYWKSVGAKASDTVENLISKILRKADSWLPANTPLRARR